MWAIGGWIIAIAMKFGRRLGSTAAEAPTKCQSNTSIVTPDIASLCEIFREDILCDIESVSRALILLGTRCNAFTKPLTDASPKGIYIYV